MNAVIESDGVLILWVLSSGQEVLLAHVVRLVVHHERPALHPAGAASAQVRGDFRAVAEALIRAALEVPPLEEDDLVGKTQVVFESNLRKHPELNVQVSSVIIVIITLCCMVVDIQYKIMMELEAGRLVQ